MCEPLTFVYVRHGKPRKPVDDSDAANRAKPLSDKGFDDAVAAGQWLLAHGIVPDLVVHTATRRTEETAAIIQEVLGTSLHPLVVPGGFPQGADAGDIDQYVNWWQRQAGRPVRTVMFVGHHTQQHALVRELGGTRPDDKARGAVLTYTMDTAGEWHTGPCHPGQ